MRKSKRTKMFVAGLAVWVLALPRVSFAADSEVEELKRDVRSLQAQVQALRAAIAETAELDRQKSAILLRALKTSSTGPEPAPAVTGGRSEPTSAARSAASENVLPPSRRAEPQSVVHRSAPPPPVEAPAGSVRGKVAVPGGEPVAYVYVENVLAAPVKGQRVVIEQSGKRFIPGWAVVQRGTSVEFPNKDNIFHNVFSLSSGNAFDLGMYNSGGSTKAHTFMESGPVDVYCNIHPQMAASVLVVPNRHYAKVKADGSFEIAGVPAGRRKVVAWAPGSRPTVEWVEVAAGSSTDVSFKLDTKSSSHKNKVGQAYGSYE